jgi:hypothetical protein
VLLQAPTSWLNALLAGGLPTPQLLPGGGYYGLHLVPAIASADRQPAEYPGGSAAVAALINASTRSIAVPAGFAPAWLEIPIAWVRALAGAQGASMPTSGVLQLSADCGADIQGAYAAAFQALGFTTYTPAAPGPWPIVAG